MKKIKFILLLVFVGLVFSSCESDIDEIVISSNPTEPVLESPSLSVDFNIDNIAEEITFSWTTSNFGYSSSITYTVQIDVDENFTNPNTVLAVNNAATGSITVGAMNSLLWEKMGLPFDTPATLNLRVKASVSDNYEPVYSNVTTLTLSPFVTDFTPIYMIGSALDGWDLAFPVEVPGIEVDVYETTHKFTKGGHFRFFKEPDWSADQWGYDYFTGTVTDLLVPQTDHDDPNYRFDGGTGNYKITVDLANKTIAMELVGDVEPETPEDYVFGIIGNAYEIDGVVANWDNDVIFTYASTEGDVYTYSLDKITLLADGEFKIRKDRDWVVSYGFADVTIQGDVSNFVDAGGNIKVVAEKTYSVDFVLDVANDTKTIVFTERGLFPEAIWLVGSINGWNNHGQYMAARGNDVHVAYQYLDDAAEIKFLTERDSWDLLWGAGENAGEIIENGGNIVVNTLPDFAGAGFYEIKADLANGTIMLTQVAMGVIGDAQEGAWDTDVDLTYNEATKVWEGQVSFLATGNYKFRANDDWAINFGGSLDNLTHDGADIATPGEGTYNVTLDLSGADAFTATVTK